MGPDDYHPNVNNNAYTNAAASLSIHFARYLACMCDRIEREEVPDDWIHKALYLDLPYDNVKRLHFQYEGFEFGSFFTEYVTLLSVRKLQCQRVLYIHDFWRH